jgi:hypothetical protein
MLPSIILKIRKHQTFGRNQVKILAEVWSKNLDSGTQTLSKKLHICGPKNSPPKFQPLIRSKSARTKTRTEGTQCKS